MKQISLTLVVVTLFAGITIVGCPPPEVKKESPTLTFDATSETSAAEALGGHVLSFTPTEDGGTFTIDQEVLSDTLGPLDMTTVEGVETLDVADGYDEFAFGGDETFTLYVRRTRLFGLAGTAPWPLARQPPLRTPRTKTPSASRPCVPRSKAASSQPPWIAALSLWTGPESLR